MSPIFLYLHIIIRYEINNIKFQYVIMTSLSFSKLSIKVLGKAFAFQQWKILNTLIYIVGGRELTPWSYAHGSPL